MKKAYLFLPEDAVVPPGLETAVFTLTPLQPKHVHLDYAALMQSKALLRLWSGSPWPQDDFTPADNLEDLEWHWLEHQERLAFTFTVLNPAQDACLGCVYMKSLADLVAAEGAPAPNAVADFVTAVRFWITANSRPENLDRLLLSALCDWFENEWPFRQVYFHTPVNYTHQLNLFAGAGLKPAFSLKLASRGGEHQFWKK